MKFSEMIYERPAIDDIRSKARKITERLRNADSLETAQQAFMEHESLSAHTETMISLAYIRNTIDTSDEFYEKEVEYVDEISPIASELEREFIKALLESPYRSQLQEKFGKMVFLNGDIFLRSFSPEIIEETQQTNKLETAYQKLIASAQISFEGENRTIPQMQPFKESADDELRRNAWIAEGSFYSEHGAELDDIFDKLVHLRDKKAKKLGYDDFVGLGYMQMTRNCYTPEDISRFRAAVVKYIVPAAEKLYKRQAERTGLSYPLSFADAALRFRDGNPCPKGSAEDILRIGRELYHELSEDSARFIDIMLDNELMDVLSKKGKAGGGYCTQLDDYKVPFIFANFNGTADDVEVITHEAGHAFAFYEARDIIPRENQSPTLEACEIHSMTMEFFGWRKSDEFFKNESKKFRYSHLAGAVTFIPYGAMVDHFQHIVYEKPCLTPAQRHEIWKELLGIYMPWLRLDGSPFYGEGKGWQRQLHIYENPFYYIDYCLAQTVALEFWAIMQRDHNEAWERYMRLVKKAGSMTFTELVAEAGLCSPFDEKALKEVADAALDWLDKNSI